MAGAARGATAAVLDRMSRRRWALAATALLVVSGMAFSFWWEPLFGPPNLRGWWFVSSDIWTAYRSAHFIGWGDLGGIYGTGKGLVTFPLIVFALAPVAMLTGHFHLSEVLPYFLPHPTSWLLLGPAEMALASVAFFAADATAERLGVAGSRRAVLALTECVLVWPVVVLFGHPEDVLGVAFALYALLFAHRERWTGAGWLFGLAVATQPLVLLMLPVVIAVVPVRRWPVFLLRSALPSVAMLAAPVVADWSDTYRAIVRQPNFPTHDHVTPWTSLAPSLAPDVVAAGPGRMVAVVAAVAVGWWARRRPADLVTLVWLAALGLSLRDLTESVMDAYYVWPTLALAVVVAATRGWPRFMATALVAMGTASLLDARFAPWELWWGVMDAGLLAVLVLSRPPGSSRVEAGPPPSGDAVAVPSVPGAGVPAGSPEPAGRPA